MQFKMVPNFVIVSLMINSNIDKGGVEAMQKDMPLMQNLITQLKGICMIIEAMVSFFDESVHAQVNDLHQLLEDTTKAKQVQALTLESVHVISLKWTSSGLKICDAQNAKTAICYFLLFLTVAFEVFLIFHFIVLLIQQMEFMILKIWGLPRL
jgi:TM2 domain-containing membrane protein YozV